MLRIRLLGTLKIEYEGKPWAFKAAPPTVKLLLYLLLNHQQPMPRQTIALQLWPDLPESKIRAKLRRHLHDLRKNLPPDHEWLIDQNGALQWNLDAPCWIDVAAFEQGIADAALRSDALLLYVDHLVTDEYDDWITPYRKRLSEQLFSVLDDQLRLNHASGDRNSAVALAKLALRFDPLRESTVCQLMTLQYEAGDRPAALQTYQQFAQALYIEVGVDPLTETRALADKIRAGKPLHEPPPNNVRVSTNRFFGRTQEQAILTSQFSDPTGPRLITITGPGGCGKTRLAREIAQPLITSAPDLFSDGVYFVDLSAITDPRLVLDTIVQTLGISDTVKSPRVTDLARAIREQRMLLILDNFEQILDAADAISELLSQTTHLRMLVTSRARLRCYGEHEVPIAPLQLPPNDAQANPLNYQAVALFADRVSAVDPTFKPLDHMADVVALCRQLDGLPLALEIVAAGLRHHSLASMRDQLRDTSMRLKRRARNVPDRHMSLHAALEWSYQLLSAELQATFTQLGLFPGSFDNATAHAVIAPHTDAADFQERLIELVEHSLVVSERHDDGMRFRLLVTVRDYATELFNDAATREAWRKRHLDHFAAFAVESHANLDGEAHLAWLQRVRIETDNLQAAAHFGLNSADTDTIKRAVTLGLNILPHWSMFKPVSEIVDWLEQMYRHATLLDRADRVNLLVKLAFHENYDGRDKQKMYAWFEEARTIASQQEMLTRQFLAATSGYATAAGQKQDFELAERLFLEATEVASGEFGDTSALISVISNHASLYIVQKRYAEATAKLTRALQLSETVDFNHQKWILRYLLSNALRADGEMAEAATHLAYVIEFALESKNAMAVLMSLSGSAEHCLFAESAIASITLHSALKSFMEQIGYVATERSQQEFAEYVQQLREKVPADAFGDAWRAGAAMDQTTVCSYALEQIRMQ